MDKVLGPWEVLGTVYGLTRGHRYRTLTMALAVIAETGTIPKLLFKQETGTWCICNDKGSLDFLKYVPEVKSSND